MSLVVWLPLNGDLTQQGLSNITASGTLTYSNSGKIGKCANVDSGHILTIPYSSGAAYDFSFSFWIKIPTAMNSNTDWEIMLDFIAINTANSTTAGLIAMDFAPYHQVKIYADGNHEHSWRTPIYDTWEHWSIVHHSTASSSNIKLYINGVLDGSYDTSNPLILQNGNINIGSGVSVGSFALNDFRIYDHCLSAKEVKELAKGLVLHYRLAGPGQENLLSQYVTCGGNNPGDISGGGRMQYAGDYKIIIPVIADADTYFSLWTTTPLKQGQQYTISCYVEGLLPTSYYQFPLYEQGNGSMGNFKLDHNGLCKLTFTMNYTKTVPTAKVGEKTYYRIFMDDNSRKLASGQLNSPIRLTNFKIEEGSIATPWCPNPSDSLYSTLGYNNNIEYDCSGYRRNGTKSGIITWDIDSPRYTTSYKLTNANIVGPIPNTLKPTESITMAMWVKLASERTSGELALFNNYESGGAGLDIYGASYGMQIYSNGYKAAWTDMTGKMTQWHHLAGTFDGNNIKTYIDGELKATVAVTAGSIISYQATTPWSIGINPGPSGGSGGMNGNISDARIYATALSAEDIAELYHSAVIVDNTGKNYAYEYFEAN